MLATLIGMQVPSTVIGASGCECILRELKSEAQDGREPSERSAREIVCDGKRHGQTPSFAVDAHQVRFTRIRRLRRSAHWSLVLPTESFAMPLCDGEVQYNSLSRLQRVIWIGANTQTYGMERSYV